MKKTRVDRIQREIDEIRGKLQEIGPMRPGSLTMQYRDPKSKRGGSYQLSYTHKMKSRTEYVRRDSVAEVRRQITAYKRFRKLTTRWVELAIEHCRSQMQAAKSRPRK